MRYLLVMDTQEDTARLHIKVQVLGPATTAYQMIRVLCTDTETSPRLEWQGV